MKVNALSVVANALLDPARQDEKSETVPLSFQKPLDDEKSLMIALITERYEGVGAAQFSRDETPFAVILNVPKVIRRKLWQLRAVS